MAFATGQVAITSAGTVLCPVPAGIGDVVITNAGTGVIYIGFGTANASITATNGVPIPSGGVLPFHLFQGNGGGVLRAITTAGTSTAGYLVSMAAGLGPNVGIY